MTDIEIYKQMLNTADICDIDIISKDHAAQLMATVYVFGDENAVYSEKMRIDIAHVAKKYGISGGRIPDAGFVRLISKYTLELMLKRPDWLAELENRYNLTFPEMKEWSTHI